MNTFDLIKKLKVGDVWNTENYQVLRVPGGWIYRFWDYTKDELSLNGVYVPFG